MNAVLDRWELVEPLLVSRSLRDPQGFQTGRQDCSRTESLAAIRAEHRFDPSTIARAFKMFVDDDHSSRDAPQPIYESLMDAAKRWLSMRGDHWALRVETRQPGYELLRWRGVTMLLPASIIAGAALAGTEREGPCRVRVLPTDLAPREPVGHLHIHYGPMLPFESLWISLFSTFMQRGSLDARDGKSIASIGKKDLPLIAHDERRRLPGLRWQWILELAFTARTWLMIKDPAPGPPSVLRDFSAGGVADLGRRTGVLLSLWSDTRFQDAARFGVYAARTASRHGPVRRRRASRVDYTDASEIVRADGDDEVRFLAHCFRRCAENGKQDAAYARLFYQYLRVKVALHSQLVVDPWTVGLQHFLDVVSRDGPYTNAIGDISYLKNSRLNNAWEEKPLNVDALEIHTPPSSWIKLPRRNSSERHVWILSFIRAQEADSGDSEGKGFCKNWRNEEMKAGVICRFFARRIAARPTLLREIRGLSLMGWERNGPVWLFAESFRRLIAESARIAAENPRLRLRPLQTALHLGEDFDHLLTGLRQIYEPFEWGLIERGDRIGHALALSRTPKVWCDENPCIRMRPWDRILDVGFAYWAFDRLGLRLEAGMLERLRVSARTAILHIFGDQSGDPRGGDPLERALYFWLSLWPKTTHVLPSVSHGVVVQEDSLREALSLRDRMMTEGIVGRRAQSLSLPLDTHLELPLIEAIHDAVFARVASTQIAIEVNPSSNLLIGGFRSIFEQPVFHTDKLPILINADDPLTFATTLADEYAYAWAGMVVGMGHCPTDATRRLEEAARCSMKYLFTEAHERGSELGHALRTARTNGPGELANGSHRHES